MRRSEPGAGAERVQDIGRAHPRRHLLHERAC
jgi:hypothetical protein